MAMPEFSMRQLLEAGVHFGHHTRRWNPKMAPYIFGVRNGIHIIDLEQTVPLLHRRCRRCATSSPAAGACCFVGTKRQAQDTIAEAAKRCGQYYVNHRWLGGMLTNWKTISQSIKRLREVEERIAGAGDRPDQEGAAAADPRARQARARAGRHQGDGRPARHPVRDRHQQGSDRGRRGEQAPHPGGGGRSTPTRSPTGIAYPIPGNDDAMRAIQLYCDLVAGAVLDGLQAGAGRVRRRYRRPRASLPAEVAAANGAEDDRGDQEVGGEPVPTMAEALATEGGRGRS